MEINNVDYDITMVLTSLNFLYIQFKQSVNKSLLAHKKIRGKDNNS